ncbi:MAG: DUF4012 domain-containing protein [Candidatus Andersenbacteria bacterium]
MPRPTSVARLRKPRTQRAPLRVIRRGLVRSGLSWFLVCAVLSASAIGLFSVLEHGRAAKTTLQTQASSAEQALTAAATALGNQNPQEALAQFDKASGSFNELQSELASLSGSLRALLAVLPGDPLAAADSLAEAGLHVAAAGRALTGVVQKMSGVQLGPTGGDKQTLTDALVAVQPDIKTVSSELTQAGTLLLNLDTRSLPQSIAQPVTALKTQLPAVLDQLRQLSGLTGVLAEVAGATTARTYAVVFQNPNELRPTGGFWGQIAFVKLQHGQVERLDIKSIYAPAGQVRSKLVPPEGLDVISKEFALQDANWYPNFATSARVLLDFLSQTGDPRLDGVIALNPRVVTDLLALTGPVKIDQLGLTVTEDTFVEEAQYEVAKKDTARDQTFFPSFAEQLLQRVFALNREQWLAVAGSLMQAVEHKDIQIFFGDATLAQLPTALGAEGSLASATTSAGDGATLDIVAPVFANIGGGKTDQYVQESRQLLVEIGPSSVRHELHITRKDTRTDQFKDRANREYLRVYAPAGARLVQASGFDTDVKALLAHDCPECTSPTGVPPEEQIQWDAASNTKTYQEAGQTVFANWVTLKPGEERTLKLVFDVPTTQLVQNGQLRLLLWRQAGSADVPIDVAVSSLAQPLRYVSGGATQRLLLDRDHVIGVVLQ